MPPRFRHALIAGAAMLCLCAAHADDIRLDLLQPHPLPVYPQSAKQAGKTGTTVIAVHVNELGKPFGVQTAVSSGSEELDKAGIEAVRRWRFEPARQDGEAIAEWTAVGIRFDASGVTQIDVPPDTEVAQKDRNKIVCKILPPATGSQINDKPVCLSKAQWQAQARQLNANRWTPPAMGGSSGSKR